MPLDDRTLSRPLFPTITLVAHCDDARVALSRASRA